MMNTTTGSKLFEIKVALIGHVSVGKTTVLNALFREKYSEVSMQRSTAAVNYFRIIPPDIPRKAKCKTASDLPVTTEGTAVVSDDDSNGEWQPQTAESTLKRITSDNIALRDSKEVQERIFDVKLNDHFCDMRENTSLVVVDIPGINEAGSESRYEKYVTDKWETFDIVVAVMDGKQGVISEEQVKLLNMIKDNLQNKRYVPVIILFNKIDDPEEEGISKLVAESRQKIEETFDVSNRTKSLQNLMRNPKDLDRKDAFPVFIPTSAIHAFMYQTASLMSLEQFKRFDKDMVEKLGKEEVGKWRWKEMDDAQRLEETHKVVSDPLQYERRLESTCFDKFLSALKYAVGDHENQKLCLQEKLKLDTVKVLPAPGLATAIRTIYERSTVLGNLNGLTKVFWQRYEELEHEALESLTGPDMVSVLSPLIIELEGYCKLGVKAAWADEEQKALYTMKDLVRRQLGILFQEETRSRSPNWMQHLEEANDIAWNNISHLDWKSICHSILLLSYSKRFCTEFGREKILLELLIDKINESSLSLTGSFEVSTRSKDAKKRKRSSGPHAKAIPQDAMLETRAERENQICNEAFLTADNPGALRLKIPDDPSSPDHWAHIAWKYCDLLDNRA